VGSGRARRFGWRWVVVLAGIGVVCGLPALASAVQPYLPTRYWLAWIDFFRQPIFWPDIQRGFAIQAVYVLVFLAAGWANFATNDGTT
jgi:hypothetical protein